MPRLASICSKCDAHIGAIVFTVSNLLIRIGWILCDNVFFIPHEVIATSNLDLIRIQCAGSNVVAVDRRFPSCSQVLKRDLALNFDVTGDLVLTCNRVKVNTVTPCVINLLLHGEQIGICSKSRHDFIVLYELTDKTFLAVDPVAEIGFRRGNVFLCITRRRVRVWELFFVIFFNTERYIADKILRTHGTDFAANAFHGFPFSGNADDVAQLDAWVNVCAGQLIREMTFTKHTEHVRKDNCAVIVGRMLRVDRTVFVLQSGCNPACNLVGCIVAISRNFDTAVIAVCKLIPGNVIERYAGNGFASGRQCLVSGIPRTDVLYSHRLIVGIRNETEPVIGRHDEDAALRRRNHGQHRANRSILIRIINHVRSVVDVSCVKFNTHDRRNLIQHINHVDRPFSERGFILIRLVGLNHRVTTGQLQKI